MDVEKALLGFPRFQQLLREYFGGKEPSKLTKLWPMPVLLSKVASLLELKRTRVSYSSMFIPLLVALKPLAVSFQISFYTVMPTRKSQLFSTAADYQPTK
jgi:hypothetical protein